MAIKIKESVHIDDNGCVSTEDMQVVMDQMEQLFEGDYAIFVCDLKKNRTLQQNKYLFGVVLKMITADCGIEGNDLYRIFEKKYAPIKSVTFEGEEFIVQDLKRLNSKEMGKVIEQIIDYADVELNIKIPTQDELREPTAQEIYVGAYADSWVQK